MLYNVGMIVGPPLIGGGLDLYRPDAAFAYATALLFAIYLVVILGRIALRAPGDRNDAPPRLRKAPEQLARRKCHTI